MKLTLNQFEILVLIEREKRKMSQREIAKELQVSLCKVTRGARITSI